ncbi:MAG: hypothetical protein PF485_01485 [Bacteroidales bacterium]|jgi:hypothetical protein|nr:hypothetical protein [Bacteroidales bacterium]
MLKKVLIGVASLIVILSSYFGYTYLKKQQLPDFDLHKMIPTDASIIIESNDFIKKIAEVRTESKIWKELLLLPALKSFDNDLNELIKISNSNPVIQNLTKNNNIIISAHKIGKSNLGFLFMLELQNARDKKLILQTITELLTPDKTVSSRDYNNSKIYIAKTNKKEFNFSFYKGILSVSSSAILIENSLRQAEAEKSILNEEGFVKVRKTAGKNVDANVYLNFPKLNEIISLTLDTKYSSLISKFSNFGNWAELDINLKKDAVLLNGFTFSDDSNNYLNIFLNQSPISHKMNSILPSNTSLFLSFGISNNQKYFDDYKSFLEKEGKINKYQLQLDRFKNKYAIDLEQFFIKNLDEEIGIVVTDELNNNFEDNTYIIMRTKGKSVTEKNLKGIISKIAETNKINLSQLINEIQIDKETSYKVYSLPFDGVFSTFFGNIFPEFKNQYVTFIDNFLIIGNSANSVSKFIHANILHKTLDNDMKFDQFSNYLSSKSNFYFYTNMFRSPKYISGFLNSNLKNGLSKNIESFKKFHAFAVQFQQNNDMIYNNLYLQYISEVKDEAVTVWESHLDTSINFKPALVTNHYTKENEIFVQDLNNKIYLINKVGRILWKVQLNEKINSEIHQVDFYKNGKLQFLFSTKSKIHLIDRKGNYVERYPVKLRSPSTAGLAIFDYDKTLDYRIFIPCKNKNVYLYNLEGNLINGWKFDQTDNYVTSPIQHFRIKSNDYLIFADKSRVYILNRRGEERIIIKNHFPKSVNNRFILEMGNNVNPHFVTTDTSGLVRMIYLNGTVETKQIENYSSNHFFEYVDINADGFKDYLFLDKNKLTVYKQNKTKLFDYKFDNNIESPPIYYYFSYDDRKIGIVAKTNNEIFLFNSNGTLYDGFPLKGNTPFTIGFLGDSRNQFNLIVGTKYNFLYNYSVD